MNFFFTLVIVINLRHAIVLRVALNNRVLRLLPLNAYLGDAIVYRISRTGFLKRLVLGKALSSCD